MYGQSCLLDEYQVPPDTQEDSDKQGAEQSSPQFYMSVLIFSQAPVVKVVELYMLKGGGS